MKIKGLESPIAVVNKKKTKATISGSADYYGACSMETFYDASSLGLTHEDAQGWIDYVTKFKAGNFWRKDANVGVWMYEETFDNWLDTYGIDAVMAFYHSGHGNMRNDGTFEFPLGNNWGGRSWGDSKNMSVGNETARYIFFSTCLSCRVHDGHNPIRTWHGPNKGFRMLFGFETTSVDDPAYGKFFWEEWNKGKSFSQAWLDASWRISNRQSPSVVAVGRNSEDARARLFNERYFYQNAVERSYYWWRWYDGIGTRLAAPRGSEKPIKDLKIALFDKNYKPLTAQVKSSVSDLGIPMTVFGNPSLDASGNMCYKSKGKLVTVTPEGFVNIHLANHNYKNESPISQQAAVAKAEDFVKSLSLKNVDLKATHVYKGYACSGSTKGSGSVDDVKTVETMIDFRQYINGVPVINAGSGKVRITIDNDGKITNALIAVKPVKGFESSLNGKKQPPDPSMTKSIKKELLESDESRNEAFRDLLNNTKNQRANALLFKDQRVEVVRDKVGYDISGNYGSITAHREVEISYSDSLSKRLKLRLPIVE
jgi:hypothetical protein